MINARHVIKCISVSCNYSGDKISQIDVKPCTLLRFPHKRGYRFLSRRLLNVLIYMNFEMKNELA